jgi:hypothetical protein
MVPHAPVHQLQSNTMNTIHHHITETTHSIAS